MNNMPRKKQCEELQVRQKVFHMVCGLGRSECMRLDLCFNIVNENKLQDNTHTNERRSPKRRIV